MNNNSGDFEPCTLDEVADALCFVSGDDRDTWIRMGGAIKHEFGENGYPVWEQWSASCGGFDPKTIRTDWRALKKFGSKRTADIRSVFKAAIASGYKRRPINDDDRKRLQAESAQRALQREIDERAEREHTALMHNAAAHAARAIWERCKPVGSSPYLGKKQVQAHGVGFARFSMILVMDTVTAAWHLIVDQAEQQQFWAQHNARTEEQRELVSARAIKRGVMVVPMVDESGEIQNVQLIYQAGAKKFLKGGRKTGCWHLMGDVTDTLLVAEGYATGASVFESCGLPVALCFDSGNMPVVAQALRTIYPSALMMMAADDDKHLEAMDPPRKNAGKVKAQEAARLVGGFAFTPEFTPIEDAA